MKKANSNAANKKSKNTNNNKSILNVSSKTFAALKEGASATARGAIHAATSSYGVAKHVVTHPVTRSVARGTIAAGKGAAVIVAKGVVAIAPVAVVAVEVTKDIVFLKFLFDSSSHDLDDLDDSDWLD